MKDLRIGQGFDVHPFKEGRPLKLCGWTVPDAPGLGGHSDADVGLHAIGDAILGALALGDLGEHFPDSEPRWHEADSSQLLSQILELAAGTGFALVNCDLTVVGEWPRIAPHRAELRASLAKILAVSEAVVSVKATTTEGLGFVGRGEGLAALAVVLLSREDGDG